MLFNPLPEGTAQRVVDAHKALPWWERGELESDSGIILGCEGGIELAHSKVKLSRILLYAAITPSSTRTAISKEPLTPPRSSSPHPTEIQDVQDDYVPNARIYARLLQNEQSWDHLKEIEDDSISSAANRNSTCRFLSPRIKEESAQSLPSAFASKRRRLDTLFDEATVKQKKARRKGGERIAKEMASRAVVIPPALPATLTRPKTAETVLSRDASNTETRMGRTRKIGLSRYLSLGSGKDSMAPSTRHGSIPERRSGLSRVVSVANIVTHEHVSSPAPEEGNPVEQQNRQALTKIVMAGLRLYGYSSKRDPSQGGSGTDRSQNTADSQGQKRTADDDEYKLLYHQTFKAAAFAFRRHLASTLIGNAVLREMVDRLLEVFCNDPIEETLDYSMTEIVAISSPDCQPNPQGNPFDLKFARPFETAPRQSYGVD
ncbi:hypothetical protein MMC25_005733 [Agyrium rufum]|nr:hypothetical protein [Agyrium rufum]